MKWHNFQLYIKWILLENQTQNKTNKFYKKKKTNIQYDNKSNKKLSKLINSVLQILRLQN